MTVRGRKGSSPTMTWGLRLASLPMLLLAFSTIAPLIYTLSISWKSRTDYILDPFSLALPTSWTNYSTVLDSSPLVRYFLNSMIATGGSVVLLIIFGSMAGFAFSHLEFRFRNALYIFVLAGLMIPFQVILVPFFKMFVNLGLLNEYQGLILAYTSLFLPFAAYLMTMFYRGIPHELVEAARLDGASNRAIYFHIMVPLGRPAMVSVGILTALFSWNDILVSLLVNQDPDKRTLMVGIAALRGEYTANIPQFAAGVVLAALPIIVVFLVFQRRIADGITAGATKA